jgi:hypothetical protein
MRNLINIVSKYLFAKKKNNGENRLHPNQVINLTSSIMQKTSMMN